SGEFAFPAFGNALLPRIPPGNSPFQPLGNALLPRIPPGNSLFQPFGMRCSLEFLRGIRFSSIWNALLPRIPSGNSLFQPLGNALLPRIPPGNSPFSALWNALLAPGWDPGTGHPCKQLFAAFSVGRRKALHSSDYFQLVTFDTELVNLYQHFNMFSGKFFCYVPGVYYFSLNVHTWNFKETYVHLMRNEQAVAILYAQPSDRSIMQSQSLMLDLQEGEEVWVRMFKRERENAIYSEESDLYIIFNGHLIKPALE
uniref:C1q domain-containing protein n=1 Tax=Zonotrichia albicollis TaxID=44394 RepID=A0A8D2QC32_ZONAL